MSELAKYLPAVVVGGVAVYCLIVTALAIHWQNVLEKVKVPRREERKLRLAAERDLRMEKERRKQDRATYQREFETFAGQIDRIFAVERAIGKSEFVIILEGSLSNVLDGPYRFEVYSKHRILHDSDLVTSPGDDTAELRLLCAFEDMGLRVFTRVRLTDRQHHELTYLASSVENWVERSAESRTDALTGVGNHRALYEELTTAVTRATSSGRPLSLIALDFDNFKKLNDRCGHSQGNMVLISVAHLLSRHVRHSGDIVARAGGDEFFVILPDCTIEEGQTVAEKLRAQVELEPFSCIVRGKLVDVRMTVSIGVVELSSSISNINTLMEAADAELYKSKRLGRNRVTAR